MTRDEFEVLGITRGAGLCDPTPDPIVDDGHLEVELTISSDLIFLGTASFYIISKMRPGFWWLNAPIFDPGKTYFWEGIFFMRPLITLFDGIWY